MVDYCTRCSRAVNTESDRSCYDSYGVCICRGCREQAKLIQARAASTGKLEHVAEIRWRSRKYTS
jgi:hypothetical protein